MRTWCDVVGGVLVAFGSVVLYWFVAACPVLFWRERQSPKQRPRPTAQATPTSPQQKPKPPPTGTNRIKQDMLMTTPPPTHLGLHLRDDSFEVVRVLLHRQPLARVRELGGHHPDEIVRGSLVVVVDVDPVDAVEVAHPRQEAVPVVLDDLFWQSGWCRRCCGARGRSGCRVVGRVGRFRAACANLKQGEAGTPQRSELAAGQPSRAACANAAQRAQCSCAFRVQFHGAAQLHETVQAASPVQCSPPARARAPLPACTRRRPRSSAAAGHAARQRPPPSGSAPG